VPGAVRLRSIEITRAIEGYGLDADVLVVVAADADGEGLALRDRFIATNVSEDTRGITTAELRADGTLPDMYVIDPTGTVTAHFRDIQHNNVIPYEAFVHAGIRPLPLRGWW